jgi:hypothetical protein
LGSEENRVSDYDEAAEREHLRFMYGYEGDPDEFELEQSNDGLAYTSDDEKRDKDLAPRPPIPSPLDKPRGHSRPQRKTLGDKVNDASDAFGYPMSLPTYEKDRSNDDAAKWLKANDPLLKAQGVSAEVETALNRSGLTLELATAVFTRGKPTEAQRRVRERVADALRPIWARRVKRALLAEALGVSERTLERLMG